MLPPAYETSVLHSLHLAFFSPSTKADCEILTNWRSETFFSHVTERKEVTIVMRSNFNDVIYFGHV